LPDRATRRVAIVLLGLVLAGFADGQQSHGQQPAISPDGHFEFHVDPWISLHHFAYHFARAEERELKLRGRVPLTSEDRRALSPEFREACASLKSAYRPYLDSSLLFDANTRDLARALASGPDAVPDAAVREALVACMPAYTEYLWEKHRAAGEALLGRLMVQLREHEAGMARQFADTLAATWPDNAIRVDISPYANWAGAYTDDSPPNITLSSSDPEFSGPFAFEILFHEAGHTKSFQQALVAAADFALAETGLQSDRYWHYVLFFVAGTTTADVLGDPDYVPFYRAAGLSKAESARDLYESLEATWAAGETLDERVLDAARRAAGLAK
jgi:hypothetical protein